MPGSAEPPDLWRRLLTLDDSVSIASLPWPVERLDDRETTDDYRRVVGTNAYVAEYGNVNSFGGGIRCAWWAASPEVLLRQARFQDDHYFFADLPAGRATPPPLLLPAGSDELGTYGSVSSALKAGGYRVMVTGSIRIMRDREFVSQDVNVVRAGIEYTYLVEDDVREPVSVIQIAPSRADAKQDLVTRSNLVGIDLTR